MVGTPLSYIACELAVNVNTNSHTDQNFINAHMPHLAGATRRRHRRRLRLRFRGNLCRGP